MDAFLNNPVYPFLSPEITPWTEPEELNKKNIVDYYLPLQMNTYNLFNFHAWVKKYHISLSENCQNGTF